jgi:hemoglobin-like flavoprotein
MDIEESLHRILQEKENVASRFYPFFLKRHPEARRYFTGVDMTGQAQLLRLALIMVERHHTHRYPATQSYLNYLGTKHRVRGIPEELFAPFRDALLAILEQFHGKDWDSALAGQWREAIDLAVASMAQGYREAFHV